MSYARRRFVAAGAAVVTGMAGLALVPPSAQGVQATVRPDRGRLLHDEDRHQHGVRRRRDLRRPGGVPRRPPGAAQGWQRRRRCCGHGGGARGHRALQLRHRRWRLLPPLRRPHRRVGTIDGRETAPRRMPHDAFIDPATGKPYPGTATDPTLFTSGVSVGTPGTLATWQSALRRWGTTSLSSALRPATRLAERGFVVDRTFNEQTADNQKRFASFPASSRAVPPGWQAPGRRIGVPQPRPRRDLPADRREGHPRLLRGATRAADRRHGAAPAEEQQHPLPGAPRLPDGQGPRALPGAPPEADARRLPRARRLRCRSLLQRRFDRGRGVEHPRALPDPHDGATLRRCTTTSRPVRWPSPTARSTSATRRT